LDCNRARFVLLPLADQEQPLSAPFTALSDAMGAIPDGASVSVTKFNPMEAIHELTRQCRVGELHAIGDCGAPRQLKQAIFDGSRVARHV
jgi:hypothetical protein